MANSANPEPATTATIITNFNEVAIRAPRPGFFVGDCVREEGTNPIVRHYELNQDIPPSPALFPLGSLTQLPIEILHHIVSYLDLLSVLDFRSVNQRSAAVVTSSYEFNIITSFPKALSAVVSMKCRFYSLGRLATCLSNTKCSRCEMHFGELLYLITAERVCWSCWRRFRDFIPKVRKDKAELSLEMLEQIPHITALCGLYGGDPLPGSAINNRGPLFDRRAFVAELEKMNATQGQVYSDPDPEPDRAKLRSPKSIEDATYRGQRFQKMMNIRFTVFLRAPYFDQDLQAFVGGYFCRACIGRERFAHTTRYALGWKFPEAIWHEPWRRYTREGFWEHVEKYGQILRNDIDGTFAHDSPRAETQTPDDVQWEMYEYEDELLADGMDWPDDQPIPNVINGECIPHNCQ